MVTEAAPEWHGSAWPTERRGFDPLSTDRRLRFVLAVPGGDELARNGIAFASRQELFRRLAPDALILRCLSVDILCSFCGFIVDLLLTATIRLRILPGGARGLPNRESTWGGEVRRVTRTHAGCSAFPTALRRVYGLNDNNRGRSMSSLLILTIVAVAIVLFFDYTNGFHDAANIVATIIASRAMTPAQAVIIVGTFEFLGPLLGGNGGCQHDRQVRHPGRRQAVLSLAILISGLMGAIVWNLATWYFGIPSSSSHALVGGLIGAVCVSAGIDHVVWGFSELMQGKLTGITKVLASLILSPLLGFWAGFIILRLFVRADGGDARRQQRGSVMPSS